MKNAQSNVVLIGMPGSGKSTVGVILAKKISRNFVDTDVLIQMSQKRKLQDIINADGYTVLRMIEKEVLLSLSIQNHVIATGGSAVYSKQAMAHLKSDGTLIFLDVQLTTVESRVHDFSLRGIAKRPDQNMAELFQERFALYSRYADISIKCDGMTQEQVCETIIAEIRMRG